MQKMRAKSTFNNSRATNAFDQDQLKRQKMSVIKERRKIWVERTQIKEENLNS